MSEMDPTLVAVWLHGHRHWGPWDKYEDASPAAVHLEYDERTRTLRGICPECGQAIGGYEAEALGFERVGYGPSEFVNTRFVFTLTPCGHAFHGENVTKRVIPKPAQVVNPDLIKKLWGRLGRSGGMDAVNLLYDFQGNVFVDPPTEDA